jgi:hypothetical protein
MKTKTFSLFPFPGTGPLPYKITGAVFRRGNTFSLDYHLLGQISDIEVPSLGDQPERRIGLWENTCFEFFIRPKDSPLYWEFNLSPSGDWNVFRFENYRQGLFEEKAFSSLPVKVLIRPDSMRLGLEFDLSIIDPAAQIITMAVSAVIKTQQGGVTLWALTHPGQVADFHHRDGFIITL